MQQIEWTQKRLEELIANGAEESVYLDFKAAPALSPDKKKDICKDVSAFANSDGGVLIYGIEERENKAFSFSFVDGNAVTKEWLDQVIKDGIQRRIDGIRIHPVRIDSDMGKTVYVVEVLVSPLAPHITTKDNKFYKRFNFHSVAMEEYEVRNTYNRKQDIKLEVGEVRVGRNTSDKSTLKARSFIYTVTINLSNVGRVLAKDYRLKVYLPNTASMSAFDNTLVNSTDDILGNSVANLQTPTIFPGEELSVLHFELGLSYEVHHKSVPLHCFIYTETGTTDVVVEIADKIAPIQEKAFEELKKTQKQNSEMMKAIITQLR
jgi:hypothetical protein